MQSNQFDLSKITNEDIKGILDKYLISSEIDEDGDFIIKEPMRHYIKIEKEEGILRFYRFIYLTSLFDIVETEDPVMDNEMEMMLLRGINELNMNSFFTRFALFKKSIIAESSIVLEGFSDEKSLVKSIKYYQSEMLDMEKSSPLKKWI